VSIAQDRSSLVVVSLFLRLTNSYTIAPLKHKENVFRDSVSPLVGDSNLCHDSILESAIHGHIHVNNSDN